MKTLLCSLLALLASVQSFAQVTPDTDSESPNMIEIGTGIRNVKYDGNSFVDVLLKVDGRALKEFDNQAYFVVARIRSDVAFNKNLLTYADIELNTLGVSLGCEVANDPECIGFISASLLNLNVSRNVDIDSALDLRFSLVGIKAGIGTQITDEVKAFVNMGFDVSALAISQRFSDMYAVKGKGYGVTAEVGVQVKDKLRVALTGSISEVRSGKDEFDNSYGGTCNQQEGSFTDELGNYYYYPHNHITCQSDGMVTFFTQTRYNAKAALSIMYNVTKNVQLFGKAGVNVYRISDMEMGEDTTNKAFQLLVGMKLTLK